MTASGQLKFHQSLYSAGWDKLYPCTSDLLCLDFCRLLAPVLPCILTTVTAPLRVLAWAKAVKAHPECAFVNYIIQGFTHGFTHGFHLVSIGPQSSSQPPQTCCLHSSTRKLLPTRTVLGSHVGPFSSFFLGHRSSD